LNWLATSLVDLLDSWVERPIIRQGCNLEAQLSELVALNACRLLFINLLDSLPFLRGPLFNFEVVALTCLISALELSSHAVLHLGRLLMSNNTLSNELSLILLSNRFHLRDTLVH
jgi:hypothetical protein